jgi:hypothetical protein
MYVISYLLLGVVVLQRSLNRCVAKHCCSVLYMRCVLCVKDTTFAVM